MSGGGRWPNNWPLKEAIVRGVGPHIWPLKEAVEWCRWPQKEASNEPKSFYNGSCLFARAEATVETGLQPTLLSVYYQLSQPEEVCCYLSIMLRVNCFKLKKFRHLVTLVLSALFIYSGIENVIKYKEKKTILTHSTRSASEVIYPSVTLCPHYDYNFTLSKTLGTKNLTEYYESLRSHSLIKERIIYIYQPYNTENGCVSVYLENLLETKSNYNMTNRSQSTIFLNDSNYGLHPDTLSTHIIPNIWGRIDKKNRYFYGIQECLTYNPPGPTTPGILSTVSPLFSILI